MPTLFGIPIAIPKTPTSIVRRAPGFGMRITSLAMIARVTTFTALAMLLTFAGSPPPSHAQAVLSAAPSPSVVPSWSTFDIVISLDAPEDVYFLGLTMSLPYPAIRVQSVAGLGAFEGGLSFHETFQNGSEGISISRTGAGGILQAGAIARITLQAAGDIPSGQVGFGFSAVKATDSAGDTVSVQIADTVHVEFKESINQMIFDAFLLGDTLTITEGESRRIVANVQAAGVTMDSSRVGRIAMYLGVYDASAPDASDLSAWPSSAWLPMRLISDPRSSTWVYDAEAAWRREPGLHLVALKGVLDGTEVSYGGIGGLITEQSTTSRVGVLRVQPITPGRFTIAQWTFESQTLLPVDFIEENRNASFGYQNVTLNGYSNDPLGTNGLSASARSWHDQGIEKYWFASLDLGGLSDVEVSSEQISSDTGPGIFMMQTRDPNGLWQDHDNGLVVLDNRVFSFGRIDKAKVPADHLANDSVHVRWLLYMDERVGGGSPVSSSGTSRIDNVLITGRNPNGQRLELWPGDTDNDGQVRVEDVLQLGVHWERRGPRPVYPFTSFEKRVVSSWMPLQASYADANGDGQVDHLDLQPIGLHFGKSVPGAKGLAGAMALHGMSGAASEDLSDGAKAADAAGSGHTGPTMAIEPIKQGDSVTIEIHLEDGDDPIRADDAGRGEGASSEARGKGYSGIAGLVSWTGADVSALKWEWVSDLQPEQENASNERASNERASLLTFSRLEPADENAGRFHMASAVKRPTREQTGARLGLLKVTAQRDLPEGLALRLDRLTLSDGNGMLRSVTDDVEWSIGLASSTSDPAAGLELPAKTRLLANYPNPFNPETQVPFELAAAGPIQLTLHDLLGRQVAVIEDGLRGAGSHLVTLDASRLGLSSGIYVIRLKTGQGMLSMPLTLAK